MWQVSDRALRFSWPFLTEEDFYKFFCKHESSLSTSVRTKISQFKFDFRLKFFPSSRCSRDAQKVPNDMNYEKVQKYLKSLQNAGITGYDLNGYQNYINQSKLHRQRSRVYHPQHYQMPIYAPVSAISASSGYMTNPRMYAPPSNYYHDYYYNTHDERRTPRETERPEKQKPSAVEDPNLSYTGADREMADSYLKSLEAKERGM